jgi:hypothetical protein
MIEPPSPRHSPKPVLRTLGRLFFILLVVVVVNLLLNWLLHVSHETQTRHVMVGVIVTMLLAYTILIAIPFVPGIEIGLSLIFMRGDEVVVLVYLATVAGLMLAFMAGRLTQYSYLAKVFSDLRLTSAAKLLNHVEPLSSEDRLDLLRQRLPSVLRPLFVDFRYVAIAILVNIPGNALIGGGGGILMVAGLSRLFTIPAILMTLFVAVAPVPLLVLLFDLSIPFNWIGGQ